MGAGLCLGPTCQTIDRQGEVMAVQVIKWRLGRKVNDVIGGWVR